MAKRPFIPIPPPAPIPEPETLDVVDVLAKYVSGEIDLVCVMGPTASGKTRYAVALAREINRLCAEKRLIVRRAGDRENRSGDGQGGCRAGLPHDLPLKGAEIISADSRQIYKGMDIGTGKDLAEYGEIPYHLIDIVPSGEKYNISRYQMDFAAVYADCLSRGVVPILCGGSGLYVEAATRPGYGLGKDPDVNLTLPRRTFYIATVVDRETRRARIDRRLDERLEEGMVDEVRGLLSRGIKPEDLLWYGLEYKYITLYIIGELSFEQMHEQLQNAIHQFAKRQMTWLRGMEKDGVVIHWVEP